MNAPRRVTLLRAWAGSSPAVRWGRAGGDGRGNVQEFAVGTELYGPHGHLLCYICNLGNFARCAAWGAAQSQGVLRMKAAARSRAELNDLLGSRSIDHVVVLGANGAMGYGSGALFTSAVPRSRSWRAPRTRRSRVSRRPSTPSGRARSPIASTRATTTRTSTPPSRKADIIFEALTEDFELKRTHVRARRQAAPARLDRRHRHERPLDQRARRGPQRVVPEALPRAALLQPTERHRRDRAHRRQRHRSRSSSSSSTRTRRRCSAA